MRLVLALKGGALSGFRTEADLDRLEARVEAKTIEKVSCKVQLRSGAQGKPQVKVVLGQSRWSSVKQRWDLRDSRKNVNGYARKD